jgi:rare lipoprotein A
VASWYGRKFHGNRTSNGETYNMFAMSAAHRTLPLPSFVRVTNLRNGRSVVVRVNDRGPFWSDRLIDLSWVAARRIGVLKTGTALVEVRGVGPGERAPKPETVAGQPAPRLYLQVGAFANLHNARALRARLERAGFGPVVIQEFRNGVGTLHRVRIGPLATVAEGDALESRVIRSGIPDAQLVVD